MNVTPVTSGECAAAIASAMEIRTLLQEETRWADLEWDRDLLISWYNEVHAPQQGLEPFPTEEGQMAFDEARTVIRSELRAILDHRSAILGANYPFDRDEESGVALRLRGLSGCTPQMVAYLWLSLFEAIDSDGVSLEISEATTQAIRSEFAKAFEAVVCFAMLGKADGPIWYLGHIRGVHKLLKLFGYICRRVGSGIPKTHAQLNSLQRATNDAGIDVVLVERQQDATMFLVGATIQKTNRRQKVIGADSRARFRAFFLQPVRATTQGVMAVPFSYSETDADLCSEKECQYLHLDLIREKLGLSAGKALGELRHSSLALRHYTRTLANGIGITLPLRAAGCQQI